MTPDHTQPVTAVAWRPPDATPTFAPRPGRHAAPEPASSSTALAWDPVHGVTTGAMTAGAVTLTKPAALTKSAALTEPAADATVVTTVLGPDPSPVRRDRPPLTVGRILGCLIRTAFLVWGLGILGVVMVQDPILIAQATHRLHAVVVTITVVCVSVYALTVALILWCRIIAAGRRREARRLAWLERTG